MSTVSAAVAQEQEPKRQPRAARGGIRGNVHAGAAWSSSMAPIHASRTTGVVAAWARTCGQTGLGHEDNLGGGGINNGRFRSSIRMRQAAQLAGERWTAAG
jgi:hypothetical protein